QQAYATMTGDGGFAHDASAALWSSYEGRATLNEMIAAASALAGPEKTGLHALLIANSQCQRKKEMTNCKVIDVEVAFRSIPAMPDASADDLHVVADAEESADSAEASAKDGNRQDRLH